MNPKITSCIKAGFHITRKSSAGVGIYITGLVAIFILSAIALLPTKPPFQSWAAIAKNRAKIEQQSTLSRNTQSAADKSKPHKVTPEEKEVFDWLKKAWPAVVLLTIFLILGIYFLEAGKIWFLAKKIREDQAGLADFLAAGWKLFWPLITASILSISVLLLPILLCVGLASLSFAIMPHGLAGILAFFAVMAVIVFLVWLGVRLYFLGIAVVADQKSPIEAWKSSFHATLGRWWPVLGFGIVLWLLSVGADIVMNMTKVILAFVAGKAVGLLVIVLGFVVKIFISFLNTGAAIYYYDETKKIGEAVSGSNPI